MRCIDGDALIKALIRKEPFSDCSRVVIAECIEEVRHAPTIEPEREKGEWIEDGYNHYKAVCSRCGEPCATYIMTNPRDRFCKWCGADMRKRGEQ